jgi:trehalose 6-phosphate synthase
VISPNLPHATEDRTPTRASGLDTVSGQAELVVVANRLPFHRGGGDGDESWSPSPGGLVTALTKALSSGDCVWIGWTGETSDEEPPLTYDGIKLVPVHINEDEYDGFYLGFSNATLWPLYHDAVRAPTFDREWWHSYREVNARFATAAAAAVAPGGTVWIHDYQLQLVPAFLREMRPDVRIGFFLHIPFPPRELFMQLPWRQEILTGLLGADLVGFQVPGAASNFSRLARRLLGIRGTGSAVEYEGRTVRIGAFPISVDSRWISDRAARPEIRARAREIRRELGDPETILLGVDRLDYTKGIDQRIRAAVELFVDGTFTPSQQVMVQIAVPSREEDTHYLRERQRLEQVVSEVNGEHAEVGHPVIHYLHQSVDFDELLALYLAADVMLVTPLRDGMNLVAKEYVASRTDLTGALVLSEFAGAAAELHGAFMVNPHDLDDIKEVIRQAIDADPKDRRQRMRRMRRVVLQHDVHAWADSFLTALRSTDAEDEAAAAST